MTQITVFFSNAEQLASFKNGCVDLNTLASIEPGLPIRQSEMRTRMALVADREKDAERKNKQAEQQEKLNRFANRGADCRAALIILTSAMFRADMRVWAHVNIDHCQINFRKILAAGGWSGGQYRMLQVAASLFNETHTVNLYRAINGLDSSNTSIVLRAICAAVGRPYVDYER